MRDDLSGLYVVIFNPKILTFYDGGWTAIDWQDRQRLRGKPLALWLHGYLASHAKPYPIKIDTIRAFSGSNNKQIDGFKRSLVSALNELQKIGFILGFDFEGDTVIINKPPTPSQQRFLFSQ
jgi:TrfA protein